MKPDSSFWTDSLRLAGLIAAVITGRYFSKDQWMSVGLLLVALLLFVWLLMRLFRFFFQPSFFRKARGYLGALGFCIYLLSGLFAVGLAGNFVWSLFKGDLSPWWFWPAGVVAIFVLMMIAGNLLRLVDKSD
jgi:hypothetical protein